MEDPTVKKFVRLLRQQKPMETTTEQQLERIKHYYVLKRHQKIVLRYSAFVFFYLLLLIVVFYLKLWHPHMACVVFVPARVVVMYLSEVDKTIESLGNQRNFDPSVAFQSLLITAVAFLSLVEFVLLFVASIGFPSL